MTIPRNHLAGRLRPGNKGRNPWNGELGFRSPVLAAMPRVKAGAARRTMRTTFRLMAVTAAVLGLLLLIFVVHNERLPQSGPAFVLYALHDYLFLPIKGYAYTLFYPYSWIWWGVTFLLTGVAILNWMANLNLIRKAHIRLLRWVIGRQTLHSAVLSGVRIFDRIGFQPDLLRAVAQDEWDKALRSVTCSKLGSASGRVCGQLGDATSFVLSLEELDSRDPLARWRAYDYWIQAIVYLQAYAQKTNNWTRKLMAKLLSAIPGEEAAGSDDDHTHGSEEWLCFGPRQLEIDLYRVCRQGQGWWNEEQDASAQDTLILDQLASSSECRRRFFYDMSRHLEQQLYAPALEQERGVDELSTVPSWKSWLPIAGKIALHLALYTALLAKTPRLATAYMDGADSVHLLGKASIGPTVPQSIAALIQEIPNSRAYKLVGLLLHAELKQQQQHWQFELDTDQGILSAEDFGLSSETHDAVIQAAGPVPDYNP